LRSVVLVAGAYVLLLKGAVVARLYAHGTALGTGLLVAAPLLAVLLAVRAARHLTPAAGRGWKLLAAAGTVAALSAAHSSPRRHASWCCTGHRVLRWS
jgi:hypothetical protein